jgi:hypothetical protein
MFWLHPNDLSFDDSQIAGLFSLEHGLALFLAFILGYLLFLALKTSFRLHQVIALMMLGLEGIRMIWNIVAAPTLVMNDILPLFTCGIFVFIYPLYAFKLPGHRFAESFLKTGALGIGLLFLTFPTTAIGMFPLWHINSLISLTMHTVMTLVGASFFFNTSLKFVHRDVIRAFTIVLIVALISFIYNTLDPSTNFFFIAYPLNNTPLVWIRNTLGQPLYGIVIVLLHYLAGWITYRLHQRYFSSLHLSKAHSKV